MKLFALLLLGLGAVEGLAFWWMHPAPVGLCQPVLAYRPREVKAQTPKSETLKEEAAAQSFSSISASLPSSVSAFTFTPLPESVARSIPSLRCTTGTAARIDLDNGVTVHLAFFEWDQASSTNVLEAYKHLPEECMGSIGMTLIEKAPPRFYTVRDQGAVGLDRRAGRDVASGAESQRSGDGRQETEEEQTSAQSSSSNPKSTINNHQSSISPSSSSSSSSTSTFDVKGSMFDVPSPSSSSSPHSKSKIQNPTLATQSLLFDHTVFRDPGGVIVHAFKGTWVSGADLLIGGDLRGGVEQWRQIRWKAAFKRFRPAYARVAQGAVRGIPNPDAAWQAFEQAMLKDLHFAR